MKRYAPTRLVVTWIAFVLAAISAARAQSATATIEGRVINPVTGEYLERARLSVEGSSLETFSDSAGNYRFTDVPAGMAKIKGFYTGLRPQTDEVAVVAGQTVRHDIELSPLAPRPETGKAGEIVKLSEFQVSASKDMSSAAIAINEQRFAPNTKSVVSTDEFGSVSEGQVGEFLKFVPGITIEYSGPVARGISINGAPSDNTPITVDGFSMASAGGANNTGRGVQMDMVSITNIARIEVSYSPTPESEGAALAGSVNMVPRSAFERSRSELNISTYLMMRGNAHELHKTPGPFEDNTYKVHPGFDFSYLKPVNQRFGFTLSGGRSKNGTTETFISETWRGVSSATNGGAFPNTPIGQPYLTQTQVRVGTKDATRTSFGASMDYKLSPNDRLSFSFQLYYIDFLVMNRVISFGITRVNPGDFSTTFTRGAVGGGTLQLQNTYRDRTNSTFMPTLTWRHDGPIWKAQSGLGYSKGRNTFRAVDKGYFTTTTAQRTGVTMSFADIFYLRPNTINVSNETGTAPLDPYNLNNYALSSANSNPVTTYNTKRTGYANVSREFHGSVPVTLKTGVDFRADGRDQRAATIPWTVVGTDGRTSTTTIGSDDPAAPFIDNGYSKQNMPFGFPRVQWVDDFKVWNDYQANPSHYTVDSNSGYRSAVSGSKHIFELISAGYLRGNVQLLERRLKLVGGVRAEQTNIDAQGPLTDPTLNYRRDASGKVILTNGSPSLIVPASNALGVSQLTFLDRGSRVRKEYLRYFPSINASYNIRENLVARAAYYYSIGRPSFDQYAGGLILPDEAQAPSANNRINVANAAIKPWMAKSVTARLEYYFEGVGQVSVGAFRRDFKNFFGNTVFRATPEFLALYGADAATYGNFDVATQQNISDPVHMTGVDFSYKQALTFLPQWARGVQAFANASSQRNLGPAAANFSFFVPQKYSWGVSLTRQKFNVRMNWSYQSRYRQGLVGAGTSIEPNTYNWGSKKLFLDVLAEYNLMKHFSLYANLRNVANTPEDFEAEGPSTPPQAQFRSRETAGPLWIFGIKGTF